MATARNTGVIQFPEPTGTWTQPTHYGIWTGATGGDFIGGDQLTSTVPQPTTGSDVEFAASALGLTLTEDEETAAGGRRSLNGYLVGTVYVSLHSAAPGTNGANEISGNAYARVGVALAGWTFS